jgi:hypothetical protein
MRHSARLAGVAVGMAVGVALGVVVALGLSGCNRFIEGGAGVSYDTHTYVSTSEQPKTVSLIDTRTDEVMWTVEVPVGRKLVVRFVSNYYPQNRSFPDQMRWDLIDPDAVYGGLANEMPVPTSRRLQMELRTPGEFAPNDRPRTAATPAGGAN